LTSSESEWSLLIQRYAGNPLFIKIVATAIQDLFNGSISKFLEQGTVVLEILESIWLSNLIACLS
jgi:hypothetical protein